MATDVSGPTEVTDAVQVRRVSEWRQGETPADLAAGTPSDRVRWVDLDATREYPGGAPPEVSQGVIETLARYGVDGVDATMIADLLDVADKPAGDRYTQGRIRSLSAFRVTATRLTDERDGKAVGLGGELTFQPVEFLQSEQWVITCWHRRRTRRGREEVRREPPDSRDELFEHVSERWLGHGGKSGGDLALMILHELALTYRPACFAIRAWLEDWELRLYTQDVTDRRGLEELWSSMDVLREWVQPLNRPGITHDADRSWFCGVSDHRLTAWVDDQDVDRSLAELRHLADTLRATFQILSVRLLEEQRDRREDLQRRIEVAAAGFLVPTLIVGFYGANTELPGGGTWWGFWVMVLALIVLSAGSVCGVILWQRHEKRRRDAERGPLP